MAFRLTVKLNFTRELIDLLHVINFLLCLPILKFHFWITRSRSSSAIRLASDSVVG